MKFKIKKYIYLVNDLTNLILKKDRLEDQTRADKLRRWLIIVLVLLALSLLINLYFVVSR